MYTKLKNEWTLTEGMMIANHHDEIAHVISDNGDTVTYTYFCMETEKEQNETRPKNEIEIPSVIGTFLDPTTNTLFQPKKEHDMYRVLYDYSHITRLVEKDVNGRTFTEPVDCFNIHYPNTFTGTFDAEKVNGLIYVTGTVFVDIKACINDEHVYGRLSIPYTPIKGKYVSPFNMVNAFLNKPRLAVLPFDVTLTHNGVEQVGTNTCDSLYVLMLDYHENTHIIETSFDELANMVTRIELAHFEATNYRY